MLPSTCVFAIVTIERYDLHISWDLLRLRLRSQVSRKCSFCFVLTFREMINELNSVLVPDEEVVRIQESKKLIKEINDRHQVERKAVLEMIQGMCCVKFS